MKDEDLIPGGQAPQTDAILLIGSGRLARHLRYYLRLSQTPFQTWSRKENDAADLRDLLKRSSKAALAISDDAIPAFVANELAGFQGRVLHFSGAFHQEGLLSAHPMMSFGPELYSPEFYPRIHFSLTGFAELRDFFPGWSNSASVLSPKDKALYHALCVLGGNFPVMLWHKMETELRKLGLPEEGIRLYIRRVSENYLNLGGAALTGPLVRKDESTIQKNLQALSQDPWEKVYRSFREVADEHS